MNNGAWSYVGPRIYTAANQTEHHKGKYPYYAGRGPTGSVATGSKVRFQTTSSRCLGITDLSMAVTTQERN